MSPASNPPPSGSASGRASYEVRIWSISTYQGQRGTSYIVRWAVAGKPFRRTFRTSKLADVFRSRLIAATSAGKAFDLGGGLPEVLQHEQPVASWLDLATAFAEAKWRNASPAHRRGIAEAMTDITFDLTRQTDSMPRFRDDENDSSMTPSDRLRQALFRTAFTPAARHSCPTDQRTIDWAAKHSIPVLDLMEPSLLRQINDRLGTLLDGSSAADSTYRRKRAIFHGALEFAVEQKMLPSNPLETVRLPRPRAADAIDRRVVANPAQAEALLDAVRELRPELEAYFAAMYYAGLRPAEAKNLADHVLSLPGRGWGEIVLKRSNQTSSGRWTDDGRRHQERQLKHRSLDHTRPVPAHPNLVHALRQHIDTYPLGPNGHLFVARTGRGGIALPPPYTELVGHNTVYRVWDEARARALTPSQYRSPLARRPYDLRHACLSTWLNSGVSAAQVAEWAGHSIQVLLRIYAKCLDGQAKTAMHLIESAVPATRT
jgi:integrase